MITVKVLTSTGGGGKSVASDGSETAATIVERAGLSTDGQKINFAGTTINPDSRITTNGTIVLSKMLKGNNLA